ncbi:MAG: T9SS type A sorting domain-containing protein [Flavobacteriia bacterium]|nr:T9SS type A sorting domain-containing protein [Flavobacteriia bacterium]
MKHLTVLLTLFFYQFSSAQTWSDNVAQIVYNKCAQCHHTGGISSTPLTTYSQVVAMSAAIYDAVAQDEMPPWPPNNEYQQYVHDRALSTTDKATILSWLTNGTPEGNASNTPPPPVFNLGSILGAGDLEVQIPTYMSKAQTGHDDYACFSIPSGLTSNRVIKSIEIIPGNRSIVHHALVYIDPNDVEVTDSIGGDCSSPASTNTFLIAGYTPGCSPVTLPSTAPLKLGIPIASGSNIYFAMHYPDGSYGEFDSTKVILHFYPPNETGIRQVYASPIIQNWDFILPPNQITHVTGSYPAGTSGLNNNISVLSVFPHMHLLGNDIKAYATTSINDTIPFIEVPEWDFHWQDFYFFKHMPFLPIGTTIRAEGNYNNTTSNLNNPNNPPITVYPGLNTNDEMFLVYFHYMIHQAGDENYDMEVLMTASLNKAIEKETAEINIFPNPSNDHFNIEMNCKPGDQISVSIFDFQGKLITKLCSNQQLFSTQFQTLWSGKNDNGENCKKGVYFISINLNGTFYNKRVIKN